MNTTSLAPNGMPFSTGTKHGLTMGRAQTKKPRKMKTTMMTMTTMTMMTTITPLSLKSLLKPKSV